MDNRVDDEPATIQEIGHGVFFSELWKQIGRIIPTPKSKSKQEIGKSGEWNGTDFHHQIDEDFGAALVTLLKERKISSVSDFGCGTGGYVKMISDAGIYARGFDGNPRGAIQ